MHGCGNDYIYFDCRSAALPSPETLAVRLCDRHTGIGGDGIVLILPSAVADARMRMFNRDGSEGAMCGNAIRCVAKHLFDNGMAKGEMTIETASGVRRLALAVKDGNVIAVTVDMGSPELRPEKIPVALAGESVIARTLTLGSTDYAVTCVSMGNPHAVTFHPNVESLDLPRIGPLFEHAPLFPNRVNAEFVELLGRARLKVRVWERGSGETRSCGTGACAAAVAATLCGHCDPDTDIAVDLPGGTLLVRYAPAAVTLSGPCATVFAGTVDL